MGRTEVWIEHVWPRVTARAKCATTRKAAVAFVGANAPALLPLARGDELYVDASDRALAMGATNPHALRAYVSAGVHVRSCPGLHAKMFLFDRTAIVGSANVSDTSARQLEAVVVTTEPPVVRDVAAFFNNLSLGELTDDVDGAFLRLAEGRFKQPRGAAPHVGVRLLPSGKFRFQVTVTDWLNETRSEAATRQRETTRMRARAGPAARFTINTLRLEARDYGVFAPDDVLVQLYAEGGNHWAWPPVTVLHVADLPRGRQLVFVREDRGLSPVREVDLRAAVARTGKRLITDKWAHDKVVRDTVLGAWNLAQ